MFKFKRESRPIIGRYFLYDKMYSNQSLRLINGHMQMFKLKKTLNKDLNKFIGIEFFYEDEKHVITSLGVHEASGNAYFYLDGLTSRRVKIISFNKNVEVGKFKIVGNVGV